LEFLFNLRLTRGVFDWLLLGFLFRVFIIMSF
jgi:hypothetical protein